MVNLQQQRDPELHQRYQRLHASLPYTASKLPNCTIKVIQTVYSGALDAANPILGTLKWIE